MRAVVYRKYGAPEVLELTEVEKPVPRENEVLIRTHATTVTSGDLRARSLRVPAGFGLMSRLVFGLFAPRQPILGSELAGVVEAVGANVTRFAVGDAVFAFTDAGLGCYAEYRCVREDKSIAHKPENLSFEEAAALSFGGTTALHFLRRGGVGPTDEVLVVGASGSVGSACVQLARHFGAEVTGVCSTANVELVRSLGAAHVIDYTKEDFTQNGRRYDVIVDTVGTAPFSKIRGSLTERGRLLQVVGTLYDMLEQPWIALTNKQRVIGGVALGSAEDLHFLAELAEKGVFKPVVGRSYPLEQIVEAHRYADTGHKLGNVVIQLA